MFQAQSHDPAQVVGYRPLSELVPAHWQTGKLQRDDGAAVFYTRTGGDKPALLLLHGFQASGIMWLRTAQALEADYDVVMPDFRGHGASSGVDRGYSTDILVADMAALIDALKLESVVVVGHSMGADTAGWLAAKHPELVRGVALVDPALWDFAPPSSADGEMPAYMQPIIQAMSRLKTQPHAERLVTGLSLLFPGAPVWGEADYVSFVEGMAAFDHATYRYTTDMGAPPLFQSPETVAQVACPILLMTARSMMPGVDTSAGLAAFADHWRQGQHIHFEDSGHFIPFDQFERFVEVLRAWLAKVSIARG